VSEKLDLKLKEKRVPGGRNDLGICPSLLRHLYTCPLVLLWEPPLDYNNAREAKEEAHALLIGTPY